MTFGAVSSIATALITVGTLVTSAQATTSSSLTAITVEGNAFYNGTDRFYIRGIDYQPGGSSDATDPLADEDICTRDIPYFQELGINTIRVYTVDNSLNHDTCMNALADAGIYLILDTDTPDYSLNRDDPQGSYNSVYLQSVFATIDAFAGYNNTMAFLAGNEVINTASNTNCAPYIKAVIRDMKSYLDAQGLRSIPVGYSAADVSSNQYLLAEFLNCGENDGSRTDFYSLNDYSWCDPSSYTTSGWDQLVSNYTGYGRPLFFSEFGCIANTRKFTEVASLYSDEMIAVFSGGLVFEYSEEGDGYGVVNISDSTVTTGSEFTYLKTAYSNTSLPTGDGGALTSDTDSTCPSYSTNWNVTTGSELPAMPSAAKAYLTNGAGTGPGLSGDGSQWAGNSSTESSGFIEDTANSTGSSSTSSSTSSSSSSTSTSSSGAERIIGQGIGALLFMGLGAVLVM